MNAGRAQTDGTGKSWSDLINAMWHDLSGVFRHILPGIIILSAAYGSHPNWFKKLLPNETGHFAILVALTLVVGNLWYVLHRYTLHQLLDWVCYRKRERKWKGYRDWLYEHVYKSFLVREEAIRLWDHVHFRSAQIILMFLVGEVLLVFLIQPQSGSIFDSHRWLLAIVGILLLVASFAQYFISNGLDVHVVKALHEKTQQATAHNPQDPATHGGSGGPGQK